MMLEFYKMTSASNDFVMVDNRDGLLSPVLTAGNIADICNRRFGVGADGLIVVEPGRKKKEARMRYYHADGSEVAHPGDAALCFTAFVDFLLDGAAATICFSTGAGLMNGVLNADDSVTVTPADGGKAITGPALMVFRGELIICED